MRVWFTCKELIDKGACDRGSIWNPSNCKCECDKSFDVGEYLDYENCNCREKLVDKLIEQCTETVEEVKLAKITLTVCNSVENIHKRSSCILYIVLFSITFTTNIGIATCLFSLVLKKKMLFVLSLVPILKQQFNALINGKSQTNRDQKLNWLFLQWHN